MEVVFAYEYTLATVLRVTDEDSEDFLQSQFSNDLRPFTPGQCTYGLWLDVKGKVLADSWVLCEGREQLLVVSESSPIEVIRGTLDGHIIADDVELEDLAVSQAFAIGGAGAAELLVELGLKVPAAGEFVVSGGLVLFAGRRTSSLSFEFLALEQAAGAALRKRLVDQGVEWVSKARIQVERIDAGFPAVPEEIGPGELPGEGGFEVDAISFTKGCFLGQEVVARMHNVGQARRGLYRVSGDGALPTLPAPLNAADGKSAGEVRTAVQTDAGWSGVALMKLRAVDEPALYISQDVALRLEGPLRVQD